MSNFFNELNCQLSNSLCILNPNYEIEYQILKFGKNNLIEDYEQVSRSRTLYHTFRC